MEVRLEHRHGVWVGARALINRAVVRLDGVDHVRAVVGAVSSSGCPLESTARQSGNLMRTTNLPLEHCLGGVVDHVPFAHLHSTFLPCKVTIFSPSSSCPSPSVSRPAGDSQQC